MNKRYSRIVLAVLLLAAIAVAIYHRDKFDVQLLENWVSQAGWWAPVIFIVLYMIATVLFLPGSILTLAGGALFGPVYGVIYNLSGATLGAATSFLIARYIASDTVSGRAGGKLKQLINGVETEGWRFIAFVRLVPLFPFNLLNYALGLTRIRFIEYLLATAIFMLPGAIAYTYLGYAGREAAAGGEDTIRTILIAVALLAMVIFIPRFVSSVRRGPGIDVSELKKRLDDGQTRVLDVRTEKEYSADGHIESALNIPLDQLEQNLSLLESSIDKSISIICRTDKRSIKAADLSLIHISEPTRH